MVRSHLEYAAPVWSPYYHNLAEELEKIQRRATKRLPELKDHSYEDRLKRLKLPTLVYRRIRGDLINVYKYTTGKFKLTSHLKLKESRIHTRGHSMQLEKRSAKTDRHKYSFSHRVVDWWNRLPEKVVKAPSVNAFKNQLDIHFKDHPVVYNCKALDCPLSPGISIY